MKNKLFKIMICGVLAFGLVGCKKSTSLEELNTINDTIIAYFKSNNGEYNNLGFNYVDEENKKVIVGLIDNSYEQQKRFKETIIDSDLIKFVEGNANSNLPTITLESLQELQDKITNIIAIKEYNNFASCGVDEESMQVIVELVNNSLEEQDWFRKNIIDSSYIKFIQGGPYTTLNNEMLNKKYIVTYNVLNIAESNDSNYVWLTLRKFQEEEVASVKVKKDLASRIKVNNNYEFTFKFDSNKVNLNSIIKLFDSGELVKIENTNKLGLDQNNGFVD